MFDISKNGGFMTIFVVKDSENCSFQHFLKGNVQKTEFSNDQKYRISNCWYICKDALVQIWAKLDKICDPWHVLPKIS